MLSIACNTDVRHQITSGQYTPRTQDRQPTCEQQKSLPTAALRKKLFARLAAVSTHTDVDMDADNRSHAPDDHGYNERRAGSSQNKDRVFKPFGSESLDASVREFKDIRVSATLCKATASGRMQGWDGVCSLLIDGSPVATPYNSIGSVQSDEFVFAQLR